MSQYSYYDDPRDQAAIQAGYNLYQKYGLGIDPKKLYLETFHLSDVPNYKNTDGYMDAFRRL